MSKRILILMVVAILVTAGVVSVEASGRGAAEKAAYENSAAGQQELARARANRRPPSGFAPRAPLAVGTIQYDNGVSNVLPTLSSNMWGNRFDSALNTAATGIFPVNASGSITMASFYLNSVGGTGAFISIADQLNTGAGTAMNVTSFAQGGLAAGFNVVTLGPFNYVGSSFLAGVWYFGSDVPGLGTGTTGGQGIHGMNINDSGTTLTGYTPSTTFNAIFRPTGDILTPVELMNFTVED